jgi:hypothetical protein
MTQEIFDTINNALKPNVQPPTPTKLSPRFKALARECGFVFWHNEPHGPGPGNIDWSCDYTQEFEHYSRELVTWACELMRQEIVRDYAFGAARRTYEHLVVQD